MAFSSNWLGSFSPISRPASPGIAASENTPPSEGNMIPESNESRSGPTGEQTATPVSQSSTRTTPHVSPLARYLSIYLALWKNSVTREMIFKSNFLLWIIVELLWFGLQLSFIGVLYLHRSEERRVGK